jgi:hypothetical protein
VIKNLLLMAALMAGLTYTGHPSAAFSVQFVPSSGDSVMTGICVGLLIGAISGFMSLLVFSDTYKEPAPRSPLLQWILGPKSPPSGFKVAGKISGLPIFWFGGSWLTSHLTSIDYWMAEYVASLAFSYCLIISPAIIRLVGDYGKKSGPAKAMRSAAPRRVRRKPDR